ncbi:MAG: aldehyde dehydrogenase family protein [candidate division Zixibacteria bacterium]|nr:aldehyde dehydrogenase family protein [candidate division Zixibacteria bacterium]
MREIGSILNGAVITSGSVREVRSPFDGRVVTRVTVADEAIVAKAIDNATLAKSKMAALAPYERAEILERFSAKATEHRDELALLLCEEAGKPITLARIEAERCAQTIADAAHWARYYEQEILGLDASPVGAGRQGIIRRFPVGVVAAITPFNFPLNLVAHKIAPAIAAGCPVVLKPASQTPSTGFRLAQLAIEAGLPKNGIQVVLASGSNAGQMVTDNRIALVTFTGSAEVGWQIKALCGKKKVALELGGNAAAIVEPDADWETAARKIATGGFGYAGQSCISVQRVFVHESIAAKFTEALVAAAEATPYGDPSDPKTLCGPLIDRSNVERVSQWIERAVARGGRVLTGNKVQGSVHAPTVLTHVPGNCEVSCAEVFGPVVVVATYDSFDQVLGMVNDSRYGLQAGIFTNDFRKIWKAYETIEVGGVIHNDVPTFRVDMMPYGGVKDSGIGREGARWAIQEMTEPRLLVLSTR